jgi:hypothetical protein
MITWLESSLYLYGEGSSWKVDWANRREGQGGGGGKYPEENIPIVSWYIIKNR